MTSVTLSQFRNNQSDYIAVAQREPVEITSRGTGRRAVVVSPEFFDRAVQTLEDQADIRAAAEARKEPRIPFEDLMEDLDLCFEADVTYRIVITRGAARAFRALQPKVAVRLKVATQGLAEDPRPAGSLRLSGGDGELRIRACDYRIVYEIQDDGLVVLC